MADYTYEESSRRLGVAFAFALALGMFVFGFAYRAPGVWLAIIAFSAAMLGAMLLQNRTSGSRITAAAIEFWVDAKRERIPLNEIDHVIVVPWSEGSWSITLALKNGVKKPVPGMCYGSGEAFAKELKARGVRVV
jgi:hypothetical protein